MTDFVLSPSVATFISSGFICWLSGYAAGIIFRFTRQIFEKSAQV